MSNTEGLFDKLEHSVYILGQIEGIEKGLAFMDKGEFCDIGEVYNYLRRQSNELIEQAKEMGWEFSQKPRKTNIRYNDE